MSRLSDTPPYAFAGLFVLPIAAIWITKACFQVFLQLPDSVSYSTLLPAFYGFVILYFLFVLDIVPFSAPSFIKIYMPIIVFSLIATFAFSAWSKSYFKSHGYHQVEVDGGWDDRFFTTKFKK